MILRPINVHQDCYIFVLYTFFFSLSLTSQFIYTLLVYSTFIHFLLNKLQFSALWAAQYNHSLLATKQLHWSVALLKGCSLSPQTFSQPE